MKITEILSIQHHLFLEQLGFLKRLKESKKPNEVSGLKEILFAINEVVEKHAQIEEKFLFPRLRPILGAKMGPVAVMEFEHAEIRKILEVLNRTNDPRVIQTETSKYIIFLGDHIAKEEHVLFPLSEEHLGPETLEKIAKEAGFLKQVSKKCCC